MIRDRTAQAPTPAPTSLARAQRRALPGGVMFTIAPDLVRDRLRAPAQQGPQRLPFGGQKTTPIFNLGGGPIVGALKNERWPERLEGVDASQVRLRPEEVSTRWYALEDARAHANLGPGVLRAWFRFDRLPAAGQRAYLFDGGKEIHVDRISLYLVGSNQLVLSLHDEALDLLESGGRPRPSRVVYTPDQPFQEGNWYHVACLWKGTERGDLALLVDGQLVGQETHGARLARGIDEYTTSITLDDATAFPPTGWVRIGQSRWQKGVSTDDRGIANTALDVSDKVEVLRYVAKQGHTLILKAAVPGPLLAFPTKTPARVRRWDPDEQKWLKTSKLPKTAVRQPQRGSGHTFEFTYKSETGGPPSTLTAQLGFPHDKGTFVVPYGYHGRVKNGPDKTPTPERSGGTSVPQPANGPGNPAPAKPAAQNKDVIRRGGATLLQPLAKHTPGSVIYQPIPGGLQLGDDRPEILDATAREIPLLTISADWPPMGIVRITSRKAGARSVERILYRKLNRAARRLEDCVRGVEGTTASAHHLFDPILLESITISDPSDYPVRASLDAGRVYVSLGPKTQVPEWLSIQRPLDKGLELLGLVLIPPVESLDQNDGALPDYTYREALVAYMIARAGDLGADPGALPILQPRPGDAGTFAAHLVRWETFSSARGQKNSERPAARHEAGTKVIPTFAVRPQDAQESGRGDVVTVADDAEKAKPAREEMTIAHAALATAQGQPGDHTTGWLIAFDDFTTRRYEGAHNARIARWPVGNLQSVPELVFGRMALPPETSDSGGGDGTLAGRVDDLVSMQLSEHVFAFPIPVDIAQGLSLREKQVDLGIYLVDQEVIAVTKKERKFRRHDLITMRRGVLGSTAASHSNETPGWRLDWPLVVVVDRPPQSREGTIALRQVRRHPRLQSVNPRDGYLALDHGKGDPYVEVRPYTRFTPTEWHAPVDRFGRRAFRSAFGSGRAELRGGDVLVDIPVRCHDRYADRVDSLEGVFFQASRELWGAQLRAVTWDEQLPNPYAEVKVAVRADAAPSWEVQPVSAGTTGERGLYLFDDPKVANRIRTRANQVTLRVYPTWKRDAFYRDAWKQSIRVGAVRLRYRQATRTLRREERVE